MSLIETLLRRAPRWTPEERESTRAILLIGALVLVGGSLALTDAPVALVPTIIVAAGMAAVAGVSVLLERSGLWSRTAGLLLIVLVALLVASTGDHESPYEDLYLLVLVFSAAFRPPGRFAEIVGATVLAIAAPFVYAGWDRGDLADLLVDAPLWVLSALVVHVVVQQLHRVEGRARSLSDHHPDAVLRVGADGRITEMNPAAVAILGDATDRPLHDLVAADDRAAADELLAATATGVPQTREVQTATVPPRDLDLIFVPIAPGTDEAGAYVVARDITAQRAAERMRQQFVSVTSHELRTPLTAIRGALGLFEAGLVDPSSEKGARTFQIAVSNADRLVRLVNDLLDLERLEAGRVQLVVEDVPVERLVRDALETVGPQLQEKQLEVATSVNGDTVTCDRHRIVQTLTNLLSNAIKFSSAASRIEIGIEAEPTEVVFRVRDHGRGVPSDKLEAIFDRFTQVEVSDDRDMGGSGLGLPICRSIVRQHGGRIWAEQTPGGGTTLTFTLPYRAAPS